MRVIVEESKSVGAAPNRSDRQASVLLVYPDEVVRRALAARLQRGRHTVSQEEDPRRFWESFSEETLLSSDAPYDVVVVRAPDCAPELLQSVRALLSVPWRRPVCTILALGPLEESTPSKRISVEARVLAHVIAACLTHFGIPNAAERAGLA